jgi:hypothetical protein
MTRHLIVFILVVCAFSLMIAPSSATVVQQTVSFSPNPPLVLGGQTNVVATYYVIPSGATTFSPNHDLQMETGLLDGQWVIQVIVDGRDAARQTATGNAAFLNGALLSYPTNHDVGFTVTVTGAVPVSAGSSLMMLQVEELDNAGTVVPGSVLSITQPVAGSSPAPAIPPAETTPAPAAPHPVPSPTRASLLPVCGILAAAIGLCLVAWRSRP